MQFVRGPFTCLCALSFECLCKYAFIFPSWSQFHSHCNWICKCRLVAAFSLVDVSLVVVWCLYLELRLASHEWFDERTEEARFGLVWTRLGRSRCNGIWRPAISIAGRVIPSYATGYTRYVVLTITKAALCNNLKLATSFHYKSKLLVEIFKDKFGFECNNEEG